MVGPQNTLAPTTVPPTSSPFASPTLAPTTVPPTSSPFASPTRITSAPSKTNSSPPSNKPVSLTHEPTSRSVLTLPASDADASFIPSTQHSLSGMPSISSRPSISGEPSTSASPATSSIGRMTTNHCLACLSMLMCVVMLCT